MTGSRAKFLGEPNREDLVMGGGGRGFRQRWLVLGMLSLSIPCNVERAKWHDRVGGKINRRRIEKHNGNQGEEADQRERGSPGTH